MFLWSRNLGGTCGNSIPVALEATRVRARTHILPQVRPWSRLFHGPERSRYICSKTSQFRGSHPLLMSDERNSLCRGFYLLFGALLLAGSVCVLSGLLELVTEMAGKGGGFCRPHRRESETCICVSVCLCPCPGWRAVALHGLRLLLVAGTSANKWG